MSSDTAKIGEFIKKIREEKNLTKYQIAINSDNNINAMQVIRIEENLTNYQINTLLEILKVLNIKVTLKAGKNSITI
jgi:transcriptional regulator with XRE-family HTH domain